MKKEILKKPSIKKSIAASKRPRVGGRFVPADPEKAEKEKQLKEELEILKAAMESNEEISDEDREYIGTDSAKFFERAMQRAKTYYEGSKYAKELKPIQHPSLQSIQSQQELNVTTRVLRWSWEDDPSLIEAEKVPLLEKSLNDSAETPLPETPDPNL